MRNLVANGVTSLQKAVSNSTTESKTATEEQDLGERVFPRSRQHSMRKSRVSGELERDAALSAFQSSAKLPTATPLNPITPLRWKSTKRIESEKRKLQDNIKTEEVVKEEKKDMQIAKDESKDQSKMATTTSAGVNGTETPHKVDTAPASNHFQFQEDKTFPSSVSTSNSTGIEDRKHSHPVTDGGSNEHGKHSEELSLLDSKDRKDQTVSDNSGTDRKLLTGEESTAITVDFLRARLLAERASSKAAKERIQQITKKVQELEGRLDEEIQLIRKAEEAEREALVKVESLIECKISSPRETEALSQHEKTETNEEEQVELKCEVPEAMDDTRPNATVDTKPGHTQSASLEINELVVSEVDAIPMSEQEIGGDHCVRSSDKNGSPDVQHDGIPIVPSIASTNGDAPSPTNSEPNQQEIRFSIEKRMHHMLAQMAVEMGALAEDKAVEDHVREELLKWMHQFPSVVQNILPKSFEEKKLVLETKTKNLQQKGGDFPPENLDSDQALNFKEETLEERPLDGDSYGDGCSSYSKGLKKVASLIERFEANGSMQREWEQSNAKLSSTSRRLCSEGSLSRTSSNSGTPSSIEILQAQRQEVVDKPPKCVLQMEESCCCSFATDSSTSPHEGMTAESLLIAKDNGRMGTYTPGDSTPSTYPNSTRVGDEARRSGGDGILPVITHGILDSSLRHTDFGLEESMDASLIPHPHLSPSSGPRVGEKRGDISIIPEDRSPLLKQRSHRRTFGGNYLTPESHSERSSGEIALGEPARSQAFIGWVNLNTSDSPVLTNTGDHSSLQWDESIQGRHLQHERWTPYSQAGNSNAYIRPDHYPGRNDEREIYRGRMESVSRSMEGLGSSWRSLSDGEGDETQLFAAVSSTSRRSGPQMASQANGDSGWSNYYQPEDMEGPAFQSFAHPGRDYPTENFRTRSASSKLASTSSKVKEVLEALQLAKLSIQKSGTRGSSTSNKSYTASERSYAEGDRHCNLRTDYGFHDGRIANETPAALRVWSHPEISRRYSTGTFRGAGSATSHLYPPNSAPFGMLLDAHRKYPENKYLTGRS